MRSVDQEGNRVAWQYTTASVRLLRDGLRWSRKLGSCNGKCYACGNKKCIICFPPLCNMLNNLSSLSLMLRVMFTYLHLSLIILLSRHMFCFSHIDAISMDIVKTM